ncbi:hypothetical protein [Winogradskyella sp.]|uniref:hypothetical protein n=1 Tax=Winogradskyella sp. TaxID=1883156 RepID=UPI003F6C18AB
MPVGKFLVEATLVDKLIVITLLGNKPFNNLKDVSTKSKKLTQASVPKPEEITETDNSLNDESSAVSATSTINKGKNQNSIDELAISHSTVVKSYWEVYSINNGHNSQKITRLADKKLVEKLIARNKIELKTKSGRLNELIVWEVYNTSAFMKFKRLNTDNLTSESESFNNIPYFKTEHILSSL